MSDGWLDAVEAFARERRLEQERRKAAHKALARVGICLYCLKPGPVTSDHDVPASLLRRYGVELVGNLVDACSPCNGRKGSRRSTCVCAVRRAAWAAWDRAVDWSPAAVWVPKRSLSYVHRSWTGLLTVVLHDRGRPTWAWC